MARTADPPAETTDRLRHDIDRGRASDKVDFPDPAAAPLGTDDEAAGRPASRERIAASFRDSPGGEPASHTDGWPLALMIGAGAAVAAAAAAAVYV
ncbi:MAG TPA: hypothetical protein VIL72_06885, partial [Beijerinckiaceae bacterium]